MKAYVLKDKADLRYVDVDIPKISSGWALVKVKACGICSSDIPRYLQKVRIISQQFPDTNFQERL